MKFSKTTFINGLTVLLICLGILWLLGPYYSMKKPVSTKQSSPMRVQIAQLSGDPISMEIKIDGNLYNLRYDGDYNGEHMFTFLSPRTDSTMRVTLIARQPSSFEDFIPIEHGTTGIAAIEQGVTGISTVSLRFSKPGREAWCTVATGKQNSSPRLLGTCW